MPNREDVAVGILDEFAASSGLTAAVPPRRYLWTDAFAVYTWVGLYERRGEPRFLDLARRLVEQVHEVLAPPPRDPAHPSARGLRIGKPLPERAPDEPYDPELEWDRDGQYYHYLTKWMHALRVMARATADERYQSWAVELAHAAHRAFAHPLGAPQRLYWKMSVDLSRPLVPAMGMHDPLDGLVATACLRLERETRELAFMCAGRTWATDDPLGAGGLLLDCLRLARLVANGRAELQALFSQVLADAAVSVAAVARLNPMRLTASHRLAFRELGLALGLHAVQPLSEHGDTEAIAPFVGLAKTLEDFWLSPANQALPSWSAHRDINAVTLAACLAPDGSLR